MTDTTTSPDIDARDELMPPRRRSSRLLRLLLSNEFGLAVLIAIAFTAFATTLPGFTSPFSLFTIGRHYRRGGCRSNDRKKGVIDGDLIMKYPDLPLADQEDLASSIGSSVELILDNLLEIKCANCVI